MSDVRFYLCRHGSRQENGYGDPPLNPEGEAQAAQLGTWLRGQGFAFLISSPRLRCKQTASFISSESVTTNELFIEYDSYGPDKSLEAAYQRAKEALAFAMTLPPPVVIVAHDAFNSLFLWAWLGVSTPREDRRFYQSPACVNTICNNHLWVGQRPWE